MAPHARALLAAASVALAAATSITLTAFPPVGGTSPVSGVVSGLSSPTTYKAVLYVLDGGGVNWWIKVRAADGPAALDGALGFRTHQPAPLRALPPPRAAVPRHLVAGLCAQHLHILVVGVPAE